MSKRQKLHTEQENGKTDIDEGYFRSYSDVTIHEEMLLDKVRTNAYRYGILKNYEHIRGKVVLDVGAGTGILSMFCVQAGAKKVYAVEASNIAAQAKLNIAKNKMEDRIIVMAEKVENIELPEKVDVIVSEWMGYCLLYESMWESVLDARDKWLKKDGILLPGKADLFLAPFCDEEDYDERIGVWEDMKDDYKLDLTAMIPFAKSCFSQHVHVKGLETEDIQSHGVKICEIDMMTASKKDIEHIQSNFTFKTFGQSKVHGFVTWFTVHFGKGVELHTSPFKESTHWEQSLFYFRDPLTVEQDTDISGKIVISTNSKFKRFLDIIFEYSVDDGKKEKQIFYMKDFV